MCCAGYSERRVTVAQIARRLALSRAEAEELVARPGFPAPVGEVIATTPPHRAVGLWMWPDVRQFACGRSVAA